MVIRVAMRTAVLVVAAISSTAAFSQNVNLTEDEVVARTNAVIEWAMERPGAVGLSVAVARNGTVLVDDGAGIADLEFDVAANRETVFRIGSVTKQFTAAAIMKLAEQGELSIDDDIGTWLPEFDTGGRRVTIRQLLNHASGVPSYTSQPEFMTRGSPLDLSHEELLEVIDDVPFDFEPGEGWNYSNTGYYLLGMIVEAAGGRPYGTFIEEEFSEPLGLTRTRYGSERDVIANRAQGYDYDPATEQYFNDQLISMNTPGAAGALISTAGDLVRWQIALSGGRAVSSASYEEMTTSTVPTGQGPQRYGFGLMVAETNGQKTITHTGGIPGFNSVLTTMPDDDLHVAVISNSNAVPSTAVAGNIIAALTSDQPPPLPEARISAQPGSEDAVRRMLEEIVAGEPDYDLLSSQLAEATRAQLPQMQAMLGSLGPIQSIDFVSVGPAGQDIYDVQLENGSLVFMIILDAEGRTVGAGMRPGAPPAQ